MQKISLIQPKGGFNIGPESSKDKNRYTEGVGPKDSTVQHDKAAVKVEMNSETSQFGNPEAPVPEPESSDEDKLYERQVDECSFKGGQSPQLPWPQVPVAKAMGLEILAGGQSPQRPWLQTKALKILAGGQSPQFPSPQVFVAKAKGFEIMAAGRRSAAQHLWRRAQVVQEVKREHSQCSEEHPSNTQNQRSSS